MNKDHGPWDSADSAPAAEDAGRAPANPWLVSQSDPAMRRPIAARSGTPRIRGGIMRRLQVRWPWLAAAGIVATLLTASVRVIGEGQQGLVYTFGHHNRTLSAGIGLALPWPLASVQAYPVGTPQTLALPAAETEQLLPTRDGQLINASAEMRWTITDPAAFAAAVIPAETALRDLADAELRAAIAETPFDAAWDGTGRAAIANRMAVRLQAALNARRAGVRIDRIAITRADPPGVLAESFARLAKARAEARDHRTKAEEWSARTLNNARAEAQDFERIYLQYRAAPEITRRRMYYETMERVIANNDRVIIGGSAGAQVVLPDTKASPSAPAQPKAP
ncbi:MAG: hypothetical protein RLZZ427_13 [Pseudomonadota bacterium]|jgi:membrane protease subunit HflK